VAASRTSRKPGSGRAIAPARAASKSRATPRAAVVAIIVAAGRGERLGGETPKALVDLAGRSLLRRSAEALAACPEVSAIIVVAPAGFERVAGDEAYGSGKLRAVVPGGATRQDSVRAGLTKTTDRDSVVLVHDAARPFVDAELVARVIEAAREHGAAIPVAPVVDTIKRVKAGRVGRTIDRETLGAAQTPQGFDRETLLGVYARAAQAGVALTDEAMAMEREKLPVAAVAGSAKNFKITTPEDLDRARRLLGGPLPQIRAGLGFDAHRLVAGRKLMLGGVHVPADVGLEGHSDGDVLLHALCDALLGAAAQGEIGALFPSTDKRLRGAASTLFVNETRTRLARTQFSIVNIDATLIAERPRLAAHLEAMKQSIVRLLDVEPGQVSIKVKSADTLGAIGRGEGIAAQVLALVART
jgi:2-C-methyl-D-erythritol 4-phosphate cytidylyltransferase/2-C-methyl-D-erythritol 2,4-cyclodiphosphate synthase